MTYALCDCSLVLPTRLNNPGKWVSMSLFAQCFAGSSRAEEQSRSHQQDGDLYTAAEIHKTITITVRLAASMQLAYVPSLCRTGSAGLQ